MIEPFNRKARADIFAALDEVRIALNDAESALSVSDITRYGRIMCALSDLEAAATAAQRSATTLDEEDS